MTSIFFDGVLAANHSQMPVKLTMMAAKQEDNCCSTLEVDVLLPHHVCDAASFLTTNISSLDALQSAAESGGKELFLTLHVHPSRVLWSTLRPILFESKRSRQALRCILHQCFDWKTTLETQTARPSRTHDKGHDHDDLHVVQTHNPMIQRRRLKLRASGKLNRRRKKIVLWIQPPETEPIEFLFAGLLIGWEHRLIQAQSVSGYIATLGGGFFLCHHFQTAILLARQQQRMALFLNDESMYYTCFVHQAYSHIYAGNFRTALSILRQVLHAIAPSSPNNAPPSNPVLVKMCLSARLFCKRMRRASRVVAPPDDNASDDTVSTTIDDHQRIRVVRDKSKDDDLVIPFTRAFPRV
jgi:hypothetical protein